MRAVILVSLIMMIVVPVIGADQPAGRMPREFVSASTKPVNALRLYDSKERSESWFNDHDMVVYSRSSKGDQTDNVRRGNFSRELFTDKSGVLRVRRCGNAVVRVAVQEDICLPTPISGQRGQRGSSGPRGPRGPAGPAPPAPQTTVIVNNYSFGSSATPSYQIGGNQPAIVTSTQIASATWWPGVKIINNNTATGGAGGSATIGGITQQQQQEQQQQ